MERYRVPLVPGPVRVPDEVLAAFGADYGSPDLETEFFDLYADTQRILGQILGTGQAPVIMVGEGMAALWGALRSVLRPGDRVLAAATGVFGYGIADLARACGAEVRVVGFEYDETFDPERVVGAVAEFRPKLVTAVHCETPSGTLNPVGALGAALREAGAPLFYVDAVASAGGVPVETDRWGIDLCLAASQKCLSAPTGLAVVALSERAWRAVEDVRYEGYDALLPWRRAVEERYFPYTHNWHGVAALHRAGQNLLAEGLELVFARHERVARACREQAEALGLQLFPRRAEDSSPTVTALRVPDPPGWVELDRRLRERGVVVGGSYGPLAGKVFRIGHMGSQADTALVREGLEAVAAALSRPVQR